MSTLIPLGPLGGALYALVDGLGQVAPPSAGPNGYSAINSGTEGAGWIHESQAFTTHIATSDGLLHV